MCSIDELKLLTETLPPIPNLADFTSDKGGHCAQYEVENGTSFGFNLLNQKEVGVQRLFLSKGGEFPIHAHESEKEWGIIYSGSIKFQIEDEEYIMSVGDSVEIAKTHNHGAIALEDTWLIAVSIPRISGYPE